MRSPNTNDDAEAVGLRALAWILADDARATRLLSVTGLTPSDLRARAGEPALLGAVLAFLEAHEPDLIACAEETGTTPAALVAAREALA